MAELTRDEIEDCRRRGVHPSDGEDTLNALCDMALRACDAPEVAKDAERYRWLRDEMDICDMLHMVASGTDHYDAAIDAAMRKEKP